MIALLQNLRQEAAGGLKRWRRGGGRSNYTPLRAAGVLSVKMWAAGVLSVKMWAAGVLDVKLWAAGVLSVEMWAAKNDDLSGGLSIKMIISINLVSGTARDNISQMMLKFSSYEF